MEDERDEITTTLIVNQAQLDTLIVALADCKEKCEQRLEWCKIAETHEDLRIRNAGPEVKALAEFTLAQIPSILAEIKEVYPEVEAREEEASKIIIEKPSWKS